MPMETYEWRGKRFRIATELWSKRILNWNLPLDFLKMGGKNVLPPAMRQALDAYVKNNGFAGMKPTEYLDKLFDADYMP